MTLGGRQKRDKLVTEEGDRVTCRVFDRKCTQAQIERVPLEQFQCRGCQTGLEVDLQFGDGRS
jgi:hypothetical protein